MSGFRDENIRVRIQAISELPEVADQLSELIRLTKQHEEATRQATLSNRTNSMQEVQAIQGVTAALKEQNTQQRKSNDDTVDGQKKVASGYDELGKQVRSVATLIAAAFTFDQIKTFGMDVIDAKTKIDSLKISLDVMLGSKAESAKLYQEIVTLAKQTPFSLEEVAENVVKLKAYNIATADLIPTVNALGNIAAAVGKDKLPQLTLAYGQVQNFGKLMGQELRQFTEAGVPLFDLLAASMGKTRDEVQKLVADHKIMAVDVKKAILEASEAGGKYYQLMALQSKTLGGAVSNLADDYFVAKGRVGDFFEGPIKTGITRTRELMTATIGSNSAIERTLNIIKAVATGVLTYTVATKAQAVASAALAGYEAAKNVIYGTYLLALRAATGQQIVFTAAQMEATVAARGFGLALSANPIGAAVAAVMVLTTAYYAYKAVTDEVVSSLGEEEVTLRSGQAELNAHAKAAMSAAVGTKERTDRINTLIQKYPEYFAGISAEKVTNNQLKGILDGVNRSYQSRIALAKEAYRTETMEAQFKKVVELEDKVMKIAEERLGKEFVISIGADPKKLQDALSKSDVLMDKFRGNTGGFTKLIGNQWDDMWNGMGMGGEKALQSVIDGNKKYETQVVDSNKRISAATEDAQRTAVLTEDKRWAAQITNLKKGSAEYAVAEKAHLDNIAKINGSFQEAEIAGVVNQGKKKVEKAKLSGAEISAILKGQDDDNLKQRLAALDAEEKVEINAAVRSAKNKEDARQRILAIDAEYNQKRAVLIEADRQDFSTSIQQKLDLVKDQNNKEIAYTTIRTTAYKQAAAEIVKTEKEAQKDIQEAEKNTAQLQKETNEINRRSKKEVIDLTLQMLSQESGLLGTLGSGVATIYSNLDALSGKAKEASDGQIFAAKTNLSLIQSLYDDGGQRSATQVAQAQQALAGVEKQGAEVTAESSAATLAVIGAVFSLVQAAGQALDEMYRETYQSIADALGKIRQSYAALYDYIIQSSRDTYRAQLEAATGSLTEQNRLIEEHYAREKALLENRDAIDARIAFNQEMAQSAADAGKDVGKHIQGIITAQANYYIRTQEAEISLAKLKKQTAQDTLDIKLAAIDAELTAFKAAKDAEAAKLKETLDAEKAATDLFYADKQLRLQEDDTYRQQLLTSGEAREVAALEAAKQRELDRATNSNATAEEIARIANAFDKLIADKHAEYQTAIGDKSKEVSLANAEAKAEEKDKVNALEQDSKDKTTLLQTQIRDQELDAAQQRKKAQYDYQQVVNRIQIEIAEAGRRIQIAQLNAEIAILKSKRNWFNAGKLNAAIDDILGSIAEIQSVSLNNPVNIAAFQDANGLNSRNLPKKVLYVKPDGTQGEMNQPLFDKDKNPVTYSYRDVDNAVELYDANGNKLYISQVTGSVAATGEKFFKGTDYVDAAGKYSPGVDTVPAHLTRGERVLTVGQNEQLAGLTNESVVHKVKAYERFAIDFPQLVSISTPQHLSQLKLPSYMMDSKGGHSLDTSALLAEMKGVREGVKNLKQVNISMDENGFARSLTGRQSTTTYYQNLHQQ